MGNDLQLQFLGSPNVLRDGSTLSGFVSAKATALLAYLAITGETHSREVLAELLWGETLEEHARASLRVVLANLRQVVGREYFDTSRVSIAFRKGRACWLDVDAFEEHVRDGSIERLREAVELYRGDLLSGVSLSGALSFDEWLASRREHLRQLVIQARDRLADDAISNADLPSGIEHLSHLLDVDPWREDAHRRLMHLLVRAGRRNAALLQYEQCRQMLLDELGVDPEPETTLLYQQIARGELSAATTDTTGDVPPTPEVLASRPTGSRPQTSFVGRRSEIDHAVACLGNPGCRLLTLVGVGGAGKTRLALQVAEDRRLSFRDGVKVVSLASVSSAGGMPQAIASSLDLDARQHGQSAARVVHSLRNLHLLLVLDNMEHLQDGVPVLEDILAGAPGVKIIVTSRERLNLRAEWLLPVNGLQQDGSESGHVSSDPPALRLFMDRALQVQPQFVLNDDTRETVARICSLLDGLPLGIELAASWTRTHDVAEIAGRIEETLDFLTVPLRDAPARHHSLRAAFRRSWDLLDTRMQAQFRALSVFRAGFTSMEAEQVAGATEIDLLNLVDKSLLYRDVSGRYSLHQVIRQYAYEELVASSDEARAHEEHARVFAGALEQHVLALKTAERHESLREMQGSLDDSRAAWDWMVASHAVSLLDVALDGLLTYFVLTLQYQEGMESLEAALAMLDTRYPGEEQQPEDVRMLYGRLLGWKSRVLQHQGQFDEAVRLIDRCFSLVGEGGEQHVAYGLDTQAVLANVTGQRERALHLQQRALRAATDANDPEGMALALKGLGGIAFNGGRFQESYRWFQRCAELRRQLMHWDDYAKETCRVGEAARLLGRFNEARRSNEESLAIHYERGHQASVLLPHQALAELCLDEGRLDEAERHIQRLFSVAAEVGLRRTRVVAMLGTATLHRFEGDVERAFSLLEEAYEISRSGGFTLGVMSSLIAQAELAFELQEWRPCQDFANQAYAVATGGDNRYHLSRTELLLGRIATANGEYGQAVSLLRAAYQRLDEGGARPSMLEAVVDMADLLVADTRRGPKRLSLAIGLLGFALDSPSLRFTTRLRAEPLLEKLSGATDEATFSASLTAGRQRTWGGMSAIWSG